MSTELEVQNQVVYSHDDPTGNRLVSWAKAAVAANQLAISLAKTDFVPATMKDVNNATAAIIMGDELGFSPLAALRSIYVVHGTPALYARSMVALVLSQGHSIWTVTSTAERVEVRGKRKNSDHEEVSIWTTARAIKAGYTTNKKYQTNPEEMLYSKAAAEICRKIGADVLLAIPYSVEDLELDDQESVTITRSEPTTIKRAVKEKPFVAEPEIEEVLATPTLVIAPSTVSWGSDEPDLDEPTGAGEVSWDSAVSAVSGITQLPDLITEKQLKLVQVLFKKTGLVERDAALNYVKSIINREIESSSELTKQEATKIIDSLKVDEEALA